MKKALITGVGKGIGRALMEKFLAEGWQVVGTYYSEAPEARENLTLYKLDLSDGGSIESCAEAIKQAHPEIDVLVNNAGVLLDEDETVLVPELLRGTLEVNLIGTAHFTEVALPVLKKGAHIINISSSAGSLSLAADESHFPLHYPAYKISKTALNMYTRTLANRLKNMTVSSVHPGWVRTEMGGEEAPTLPGEAAADIFRLAVSPVETGQFWHKGEKFPW